MVRLTRDGKRPMKAYREFESGLLRHTVPPPENSPQISAKILQNGRNFRGFALKRDRR
jgi:hypothetical protein